MENNKFMIDYFKNKTPDIGYLEDITETMDEGYSPYNIKNLQNYHPLYSEFFELNSTNAKTIALNHLYHIVDLDTVKNRKTGDLSKVPIFTKFAPLLDPIHYMIGKYSAFEGKTVVLPQNTSDMNECIPKMSSIYNASYIDNFFYYLTSQILHTHGFIHGMDYYGSFLGIQEKYRIDVVDDIEYLNDSSFFKKNRGILFDVENHFNPFSNFGSRNNKNKLEIGGEDCLIEVDSFSLDGEAIEENVILCDNIEEIYEKASSVCSGSSSSSSSSSDSSNSLINDSSDEEGDSEGESEGDSQGGSEGDSEEWSSVDEESESEDPIVYAYIKNFPVQMICLEKCDDTFDSLLIRGELGEQEYAAILFQVIMILATYQKCFAFTHNDLHTNNIMFSKTSAKYIDYLYAGKSYRVPTYGRIFKIIDFGRAIYTFGGKVFGSDSFIAGGDAHTQYNCEPFYDEKKKRIDPNPSFDLCRLGCSIYDFILDEDTDLKKIDEFQRTILRWCMDDRGKNILYKKSGEDRYPDFKLYKMIARTVHAHTPEAQLTYPFFSQFSTKEHTEIEKGESVMINIDELPVYI
jgi:hypothetical protein